MNGQAHKEGHVRVRAYRFARERMGAKETQVPVKPGQTVGELLQYLEREHDLPEDNQVVMVNGTNIKLLEREETPVEAGDDIAISIGSVPE